MYSRGEKCDLSVQLDSEIFREVRHFIDFEYLAESRRPAADGETIVLRERNMFRRQAQFQNLIGPCFHES
ncbi:hypothetical protein SJ05684_b57590 (plasmid) [Sinorhizobium sojae CCBAU 05684]|uniref:Uncharacterized protein n=1 Tax=Sinorhizobium sojae CCBAU 05684 TaxID=716928 RepID=A0A249PLF5_9HYPH|nr:hypothetical protein SJ05684_b57590 [Sinorhizobium sojae CCBAU 05684]